MKGAVDSSLIWTALLFTVSAVIAIPWRRRLTQTYGPNYGEQVLMLKQMTTRSKLFDFIRLPNGRILLPPVYPMFKVYLVSPSSLPEISSGGNDFSGDTTRSPSSLPEIHSGGGDVSDILNFVYNRTESESRLRPVSLYLPPDLTYETIVSKMIGKFKQLVVSHGGGSVPIPDVKEEFELALRKYTLQISGGRLFNLTDMHLYGRARHPRASLVLATLRYNTLKIHFEKFQLLDYSYRQTGDEGGTYVLKTTKTSNVTLEVDRIMFDILVNLTTYSDDQCRAAVRRMTVSNFHELEWKLQFGDWQGLKIKYIARYTKKRMLTEFRRITDGVIKRYFETAVNNMIVYRLESFEAADMPLIYSSSYHYDERKQQQNTFRNTD